MVGRSFELGQKATDLLDAEYGGQAVFVLSAQDGEDVPIAFEDVDVEEANAAVADAHGFGGPAVDVFAMQEVLLELGFGDEIGSFVIEFTEHTDRAGVSFLSGFSFPIELQSSDHLLIPIIHKSSPSKKVRRALLRMPPMG